MLENLTVLNSSANKKERFDLMELICIYVVSEELHSLPIMRKQVILKNVE